MAEGKEQTIKALLKELEARGVDASDLDELVHEAKSHEASNINNGGLEKQLEYLLEQYSPEQVRYLTRELGK